MVSFAEHDQQELQEAISLLKAYGAREVHLFGSMARGDADDRSDWDIAVRGLPPAAYFSALAKALRIMRRSLDLVDLDEPGPFAAHIEAKREFTRVA